MCTQSVAEYLLTSAQTPEKQDALLAAAKVCRSLLEDIRASGDLDRLVFAKSKRDRAAHSSHESAPASGSVHEPLPQSPTATLAAPAPWSTPSSYRPPVLMPAMFPIPPPPVFNYEAVTPIRSASPRSLRSQRPSRASVVSQSSNWTADADVEDAGDDDSDRRAHWWNSSDVRASLKHDTAAAARTRWLREQRSPQRAAPREMLAFANPRARAGFANNPYAVATRTSSSRRSQPRSPSPTHSKRSMRSSFTAV